MPKPYVLAVVIGGLVITGAIGIMVVGSVVYAALFIGRVPDVLANWGGILIGFFVGQFFNFARSLLAPESAVAVTDNPTTQKGP